MSNRDFDHVKGFLHKDEGNFLCALVEEYCRNGLVIEIGSYCGKSACYLADAAKVSSAVFVSIDHHRGSEEHQPGELYHDVEEYDHDLDRINALPSLIKNLTQARLDKYVIPIVGDSVTASKIIKDNVSMVFIDGSHTFESARNDFNSWHKKIKSGGILAIHDIYDSIEEGGQAPKEIMEMALGNNFKVLDRKKSLVALIKQE